MVPLILKDLRRWNAAVILVIIFSNNLYGQLFNSPTPFYLYYYDYKLANPAFTATNSTHAINTAYYGYPFEDSQIGSPKLFYGSYERNLESIKSGVGGLVTYNSIGALSHINYGLMYRWRLAFNETSGIYIGTQMLYQRLKIDASKYRAVTQDDPLIDNRIHTEGNFNLDFGLVYYTPLATIGAALKSVLQRDEGQSLRFLRQLEIRTLNLILTREFTVGKGLTVNPSLFFLTDFDYHAVDINATFKIRQWILFGAGYNIAQSAKNDFTVNVGLNIKDWVQIITHAYSSAFYGERYGTEPFVETMVRVRIPGKHNEKGE